MGNIVAQATLESQSAFSAGVSSFFDKVTEATAERHIRTILENFADLREGSTLELRFYDDRVKGGSATQRWVELPASDEDISEAIKIASKQSQRSWGCFLGMNPRQGANGNKDSVEELTSVYADVDLNKTTNTKEEVYAAILKLGPDMVTWSGNGYHAIWFFSVVEKTKQNELDWLYAQQGAYNRLKEFGSDPAVVTDEARVLRWCGFPNNKAEYETPQATGIVYQRERSKRSFTEIVELLSVDDDESDSLIAKGFRGRDYTRTFVEHGDDDHESRNVGLYKDLCSLRAKGMGDELIEIVAERWNEERNNPPLPDSEVAECVNNFETLW